MNDRAPSIEFRIKDFVPNDNVYDFVWQTVQPAMAVMKLTNSDVQKIIIADTDHYSLAIKELSPTDGHTEDKILRGIGKTLPQIVDGHCVGNKLIIHACIIEALAASRAVKRSGQDDALCHAIYHELGHCADNCRRYIPKPEGAPKNEHSFALRCAQANAATLVEEYAACFFSSSFLSPAGFSFMADSVTGTVRQYLDALAEKRGRYRLGLLDIRNVRDNALETIWRGLIEYAKFCAYLHGNPALMQNDEISLAWPGDSPAVNRLIRRMFAGFRDAWSRYPHCTEFFDRTATESWFTVSQAVGYRFEFRPEGDYL